jgi:hypothetical protein
MLEVARLTVGMIGSDPVSYRSHPAEWLLDSMLEVARFTVGMIPIFIRDTVTGVTQQSGC